MEIPIIDKTKLQEVKEIIDKIDYYAVDKHCGEDSPELKELAQKLQEVTGKNDICINALTRYSSCEDLDTAAEIVCMPVPQKSGLTNEEIKELIWKIANVEFDEAASFYFLKVLKLETGLDNITDYIYNPDEIGMDLHASIEEIIQRILSDKK